VAVMSGGPRKVGVCLKLTLISAATILLAGCGDLTRSDAERILDGDGRSYACETQLQFTETGFEQAKAQGLFTIDQGSGLLGSSLKVANSPDGDEWQVSCMMGLCGGITLKEHANRCIPGHVEITAIADAAPGADSYKEVDYIEVISLPPELKSVEQFVFTRYNKKSILQKTDTGWRAIQ
jgi:hypothetical protein